MTGRSRPRERAKFWAQMGVNRALSSLSRVLAVPLGMPTVLLFAQARQAVGASKVTSRGITVAAVIEELAEKHGAAFSDVVATSRIWCNGEPVELDAQVGPQDELAVLPPVSGG